GCPRPAPLVQVSQGAVLAFTAQHDREVHVLAQRGQHVVPGRVTWHPGAEIAVEETPGPRIGHPLAPSMLGERIISASRGATGTRRLCAGHDIASAPSEQVRATLGPQGHAPGKLW